MDVSQGGCVETGGAGDEPIELSPFVPLSVPIELPHPANIIADTSTAAIRIMLE